MLALEELHFEWEYGEHLINIATNVFNTVFLPCPQLGCYIVIRSLPFFPGSTHWAQTDAMDEFGYLEVEARVVDKNHDIGLPRYDVILTLA